MIPPIPNIPTDKRTIKELLQLMLDNQRLFGSGLCYWSYQLYEANVITEDEEVILREYISDYPPIWFIVRNTLFGSVFYWTKNNIKPRIKWLKKHIKKNTESLI